MTSVTMVRLIAASLETVFDAITTPEGIAQWWGPDEAGTDRSTSSSAI